VCNYINKYASEIYYIFKTLANHPSTKKTEYNILSVGCGDCADLFGIKQFLDDNSRVPTITYTGVDLNTKWQPIHNKVETIFPTINLNFKYQDVFTYLDSLSSDILPYNVVILEYVLNEIRKYTPEITNSFIDSFVHKIIDKLPPVSLVIINDINHNMVRDYYPKIKSESQKNIICTEINLRFKTPMSHTYGGMQLPNDALIFSTTKDVRFDEKEPCSSSIYIMYKQSNKI
jgi:hypothetical protein